MHMPHLGTSRRIKRVVVEPILLARMLSKPDEGVTTEIVNGIPQTAGVVGGAFDHERNCFVLFVADESFAEVKEGEIAPDLPIEVRAIHAEQSRT